MAWAWMVFGLVLLGLGAESLRHLIVRRPDSREVAESLKGRGARDLPPALEDTARIRWMIQGDSLARILAVLFVVAGALSITGGIFLLIGAGALGMDS
ncbi:hypothetical protein C8241_02825 [Paracidovorax avenae]|nr:hypothetical protein C8241_02825 [Paracidovorax avenae]